MRTTNIQQERRNTSTTSSTGTGWVVLSAWVIAGLLGTVACTASYTRPYFSPLPGARLDTVPEDAETVVDALAAAVIAQGLRVQAMSLEEGYLETRWYDTRAERSGGRYARNPLPVIRLRFFVDQWRERESLVVSEVVHRTTLDPSQPEREVEALVPESHRGRVLLDSVLMKAALQLGTEGS